MDLIVASNNAHKIEEIRAILRPYFGTIRSQREAGIELDVEENGKTFAENALIKAKAIAALRPEACVLADDSGLCVDALDGAPGVYSARFAGEGHDDEANNQKLLDVLSDTPDEARGAAFVCALALLRPGCAPLCVEEKCSGMIARAAKGDQGFGYDPLFLLPEGGESFAQLSAQEKNAISHRARALAALRATLANEEA